MYFLIWWHILRLHFLVTNLQQKPVMYEVQLLHKSHIDPCNGEIGT